MASVVGDSIRTTGSTPSMTSGSADSNELKSVLPSARILYGRDREQTELQRLFEKQGRIVVLTGSAGVGKSHCASQFCRKWVKQKPANRLAVWIQASSETTLRKSYLNVMETVLGYGEHDSSEMSCSEISELFSRYMTQTVPTMEWILILDDVPMEETTTTSKAIAPFWVPSIPLNAESHGRVLLTSRSTEFQKEQDWLAEVHSFKINPLDQFAAVRLLLVNAVADGQFPPSAQKAATELASHTLFDGSPIALVTAVGHTVKSGATLQNYLRDIKSGLIVAGKAHRSENAISLAMSKAIQFARESGNFDILQRAAFMNPDSITVQLLGGNLKQIEELCELNLLWHAGDGLYSMHGLHQEYVRKCSSPELAITALHSSLSKFFDVDKSTWSNARCLLPHVESLKFYMKQLEAIENLSEKKHRLYIKIIDWSAPVYQWAMRDLNGAFSMYQDALVLKRELYGTFAKNADIASTLNNIGSIYYNQEMYNEAREHYKFAMDIYYHIQEDSKTGYMSSTLTNLGNLSCDVGSYAEARDYYKLALDLYFRICGDNPNSAYLGNTCNSLGNVFLNLQTYDQARDYYEMALEVFYSIYGNDAQNEDLATTLNNLGNLFYAAGYYTEARDYYERALKMKHNVEASGGAAIDLVVPMNKVSFETKEGEYKSQEVYSTARSEVQKQPQEYHEYLDLNFKRVALNQDNDGNYEVYEKTKTEEKTSALALTMYKLGQMAYECNDYGSALDYFRKTLEMQYSIYGKETKNVDLANTLRSLGYVLYNLENHEEACTYYQKALAMQYHLYGNDVSNFEVAETLMNLGILCRNRGSKLEAILYFEKALTMKYKLYGFEANNAELLSILDNLGALTQEAEKYEQARFYFEESLYMQRQMYGQDVSTMEVACTIHNLGRLSYKVGNYDEALELFLEALAIKFNVYGDNTNNEDLVESLHCIASLLARKGKLKESRDYFQEAYKMDLVIHGSDAKTPTLAKTLHNIGSLSYNLEEYEQSDHYFSRALQMKYALYGNDPENSEVALTMSKLGMVARKLGKYDKAVYYQEQAMQIANANVMEGAAVNKEVESHKIQKEFQKLEKLINEQDTPRNENANVKILQDLGYRSKVCWPFAKISNETNKVIGAEATQIGQPHTEELREGSVRGRRSSKVPSRIFPSFKRNTSRACDASTTASNVSQAAKTTFSGSTPSTASGGPSRLAEF